MKRLAIAVLVVLAATGCSSTSTTSPTGATPTKSAGSTPTSGATSTTPSTTTSKRSTPTATNQAESLGQGMGAKIAFYAIAKTAGMNDSAKMDELAAGICSRIKSGKPDTVGPWMKEAFKLNGDVAAKVAIAAITSECPEYKSLFGS